MRRNKKDAVKELSDIISALKMAGFDKFIHEINDLSYEMKKVEDSKLQFVYMDLILSHIIMQAKVRGCRDRP